MHPVEDVGNLRLAARLMARGQIFDRCEQPGLHSTVPAIADHSAASA
jgi:hypothetical protein